MAKTITAPDGRSVNIDAPKPRPYLSAIVITAFIPPMIADRDIAREIVGANHLKEIYISRPLAIR